MTGKMELECKAEKGLGISVIMVELYAIEGEISLLSILPMSLAVPSVRSLRALFCDCLSLEVTSDEGRLGPHKMMSDAKLYG